jgi:hypothetical protein
VLSVTSKPFMLIVVMLDVVMLSVIQDRQALGLTGLGKEILNVFTRSFCSRCCSIIPIPFYDRSTYGAATLGVTTLGRTAKLRCGVLVRQGICLT